MAKANLAPAIKRLASLPAPETCRLIGFSKAEVRPGFVTNTYILIVSGKKPWASMEVSLRPRIYITQPDFWGIEVIGCQSGIGIPTVAPYTAAIDITAFLGKKGVEVIGANRKTKIKVP